jgi:septin family protein
MKELQDAGISTYNFFTEDCGELQAVAPFSIVASNEVIDGRRVRIYPWGTVDIENEDHSDFATLRECLLRYSIYNLIYQTSAVFYSSYRMKRLREMGFLETTDGEREASLEDTYKAKKTQQQSEQKRREAELRNEFSRNVCTKQAELETRKAEMAALHERQMQILTREYQELLSKQDNLEAQLEEVRGFLAQSQQSKGKRGLKFLKPNG